MLKTILLSLFLLSSPALAADPTAQELLASLDENLQSKTQEATLSMVVDDGRQIRTYQLHTFGRGRTHAAVEYLAPDREEGTKILKVDDQMWLYLPRAERVQKISGHMMRQGMMGSDMSYEDVMDSGDFDELYTAVVLGSEVIGGRKTWKIEATARDATVSYPRRIIWVDDLYRIPTQQELYALSGMLLKTWSMTNIQVIDGRNIPMKMVITDALKEGSRTTITTEAITFDVPLEEEIFSRRWLERKP